MSQLMRKNQAIVKNQIINIHREFNNLSLHYVSVEIQNDLIWYGNFI